jgi:hypothetical protein
VNLMGLELFCLTVVGLEFCCWANGTGIFLTVIGLEFCCD